ncbi:PDZ domain-containing protein [Sesbania bispinosa]|nr:PDZ domain-containing protein [Sesbania bispinosa]
MACQPSQQGHDGLLPPHMHTRAVQKGLSWETIVFPSNAGMTMDYMTTAAFF